MRKLTKKGLDKKLLKEWREKCLERDGYKCAYCGKTETLNVHHILGRRAKITRHDVDNGITLCAKHHTFSSTFSAHQTPSLFTKWLERTKGEQWLKDLHNKFNQNL